jgi:hypothetical protein
MMFADKTRVLINFPTAWAQMDFDVKGRFSFPMYRSSLHSPPTGDLKHGPRSSR